MDSGCNSCRFTSLGLLLTAAHNAREHSLFHLPPVKVHQRDQGPRTIFGSIEGCAHTTLPAMVSSDDLGQMKFLNLAVVGAFAGGVAGALIAASTMFAVDALIPLAAEANPHGPGYVQSDNPYGPGYVQSNSAYGPGYVQNNNPYGPGYVQDKGAFGL